jgi:hypothetical protein
MFWKINTFMKIHEIINEDISRRGFLKGAGAAAAGVSGVSGAEAQQLSNAESGLLDRILFLLAWAKWSNKPEQDQRRMTAALKSWANTEEKKSYLQKRWNRFREFWHKEFHSNNDSAYIKAMEKNYKGWEKEVEEFQQYSMFNEGISVNMSPYKEAIQNAETPKKKSAKRKVEDLFNK